MWSECILKVNHVYLVCAEFYGNLVGFLITFDFLKITKGCLFHAKVFVNIQSGCALLLNEI